MSDGGGDGGATASTTAVSSGSGSVAATATGTPRGAFASPAMAASPGAETDTSVSDPAATGPARSHDSRRRRHGGRGGDHARVRFWTRDPGVLFRHWYEVVPYGRMSSARKANALSRLALIVGGVLLANRATGSDGGMAVLVCVALFAAVVAVVLVVQRGRRFGGGAGGCRRGRTSTEGFDDAAYAPYAAVTGASITDDDYQDDEDERLFYDANERAYAYDTTDVRQTPSDADLAWLTGGAGGRTHVFDDEDTSLVLPSSAERGDIILSSLPM